MRNRLRMFTMVCYKEVNLLYLCSQSLKIKMGRFSRYSRHPLEEMQAFIQLYVSLCFMCDDNKQSRSNTQSLHRQKQWQRCLGAYTTKVPRMMVLLRFMDRRRAFSRTLFSFRIYIWMYDTQMSEAARF